MSESNTRAEIVEVMARGFCASFGDDPDGDAPVSAICGPNNEVLPLWRLYEEQGEAALTALEASGRAVVDARAPVFAFLMGEGLLDGRGFGDDPPIINGRKHPYWWRTNLRAALPPRSE